MIQDMMQDGKNGDNVKYDNNYVEGLQGAGFYYINSRDIADAYWLATPSSAGEGAIVHVNEMGTVNYDGFGCPFISVRPVVCLKSDIKAEPVTVDGVTTWTIK